MAEFTHSTGYFRNLMEKLFVYGTLQDSHVQHSLLGREILGQTDSLQGYSINFVLLPPYPVAMPDDNGQIDGQILDLSTDELEKLEIITEITGAKRGKIYIFKEYTKLFK